MVSCQQSGSASLQVLAWALNTDVFFNTGDNNNVLHTANGTDFYYSTAYSMGFVGMGTGVNRLSCDISDGSPELRLCFHTSGGNINSGWRCGANRGLAAGYDRIFYHAN